MRHSALILLLCLLLCAGSAAAQKPFTEGTLTYKVELTTPEGEVIKGIYIFSIKDGEIKKELKMDNGFEDVTLLYCEKHAIYTLQSREGKKYAIQLSMDDLVKKQERYKGFTVERESEQKHKVAGTTVFKGKLRYTDGSTTEILYTKEWKPVQAVTFNRFPDAPFFPLSFAYKEPSGISMRFDAETMDVTPVATSAFQIPPDYKMISYEEYKQLNKE
ncbi:MAG: hypothetical protein KF744_03690 [Taibaiella sp.]|nr:hypothetical protein [Taibaiella sp.]